MLCSKLQDSTNELALAVLANDGAPVDDNGAGESVIVKFQDLDDA